MEQLLENTICQLLHEHESTFVQRAYAILGDLEEAKDVVQESMIRYIRAYREGIIITSPRAWLLTVIRNLALDQLRKRKRNSFIDCFSKNKDADFYEVEFSSNDENPLMQIISGENYNQGLSLLKELTSREQKIFNLRIYHNKSYREIASECNTSVTSVGVMISNAIKKMRRKINSNK
ncbi:MAG: RNA polymerase sigma factor [Lentisphaeria bacterium]